VPVPVNPIVIIIVNYKYKFNYIFNMISIIIPCYNCEKTLRRCVNSILKQKYKDYEILLIVDEASKDKTVKIAEEFLKFDTVKIFKVKGWSVSKSRNFGVEKAKGEKILFFDADAEFVSEYELGYVEDLFKSTKADAITGVPIPKGKGIKWVIDQEYYQRFLDVGEGFVNFAATTCLAVRKNVLECVKFKETSKDGAYGEDFLFAHDMLENGFKIYHTNKVKFYHYYYSDFKNYLRDQYWHARYRIKLLKMGVKIEKYTKKALNPFIFLKIFKRTKNLKSFLLIPINFLRFWAWFFALSEFKFLGPLILFMAFLGGGILAYFDNLLYVPFSGILGGLGVIFMDLSGKNERKM